MQDFFIKIEEPNSIIMHNFIGVDIGGTKCAVILGKMKKEDTVSVTDKIVYSTNDYPGPDEMITQLQKGIEQILLKNGLTTNEVSGIGISCGGPLESKTGVIMSPPNLPGWDNVHIIDIFQKKFGIPTAVQNDANACALAEWKFGAGKGYSNIIFLTFGTGMGAGLILDGKLYSGTNDNAGEVGHIRLDSFGPAGYGKAGSFEGFCSGGGIAQLGKLKALEKLQMGQQVTYCKSIKEIDTITAKTLAEAAANGDPSAIEIYQICGAYLGKGLSVLIDILNPELIILGSIFVRSGQLLQPALYNSIAKEALPLASKVCKIVPAVLNESLGDYASLSVAAYNLQ
jgi:glucokinase